MVKCRGCGEELEADSNFCPKCGLRTEKGEQEGIKTPVDGRVSWEKDVEIALREATRSLEEAFEVAKKSLQKAADEMDRELDKLRYGGTPKKSVIYCQKCGKENDLDASYCVACGNEMS